MKLKALFEDDGAVSPVIGVILMVAITVILAAVIGTFVLGLGDRVSEAQPNAQFTFDYTESAYDGDGDGNADEDLISISHDGGDGVEVSQIKVQIGGSTAYDSGAVVNDPDGDGNNDFTAGSTSWTSDKLTAGSQQDIAEDSTDSISNGQDVKVIWTASGSDKTAVIGESEVSY